MKRVVAFTIALAVCIGLFMPYASSTKTNAAGTLQISVSDTELTVGEVLTVSFTGMTADLHNGSDVYSIRIVGGTSKNISSGSAQTVGSGGSGEVAFEDLAAGTHTVQLRKWNATSDFTTLQEITVTVKKARPTISVTSTTLALGETLKVYVDASAGNVHNGSDVYSIAIAGPTSASKNISDGNKFTYEGDSVNFDGLQAGDYTVKLRYWNEPEGVVVIQELTVSVKKVRPTISVMDTEITTGETLKVYVDASAGNVHYGDAYSIQIVGPTSASKDISDGSKFTYEGDSVNFDGLQAGTYTVKLRYWNGTEGVVVLQELTISVAKARPTISVSDTELTAGDSLTVSVGGTAAVVHDGTEVYSVRIVGGTSQNISNGSAFTMDSVTFEGLQAGTYTVQLRVWSQASDFTTLQEITVTVNEEPLVISLSQTELKAGESLTISYTGLTSKLLTDTDVYSIWFGTTSGTVVKEWNIWDTSTSMGESGDLTAYVKAAGTYVVKLRVWNQTSGLVVLQEESVTVEKATQLGGFIQSNKTEYVAGEIQYFSYQFDDAADTTNIGARSIKVYKGTTLVFEWTSRNSASSGSSSNEWLDQKNSAVAGTPGTYNMKVVIYGTDTAYPGYEDMNCTFTVKERTEGTTPASPSVSVGENVLLSGEKITVNYDGMSMTALNTDVVYRVAVRNATGTLLETWVLWDGGNTYRGLYGTLESQILPLGDYTISLESAANDGKENYTAVTSVAVVIKNATATMAPHLKESITVSYTVEITSDITGEPKLVYTYKGKTIEVEGVSLGNNQYQFLLEGLLPQDMGQTIQASLYVDGTKVQEFTNYSVKQYCLDQLDLSTNAELRAMVIALLNYGAAAQTYFGEGSTLVNSDSRVDQSELEAYISEKGYSVSNPAGVIDTPVADAQANGGDYQWISATLGLYDTIKIRVKFYAKSVENLTILADGATYTKEDFVKAGTNLYYVYIPVNAGNFAKLIEITFQDTTGTVGTKLEYSVNTYINYAMNNGSDAVKELVETIYYYGVIAAGSAN